MKRMMKKKAGKGIVVVLVAAVFLVVGTVSSAIGAPPWSHERDQRGGSHRQRHQRTILGIWKDQQVVEQLGFTQEQVQQLRDAYYTAREKRLKMKSQLDQLRLEMDKALSSEVSDAKSVRQLAQKAADVEGKLYVQKIEERMEIKTILTAEQIQKLKLNTRYKRRGGGLRGEKRSYGKRHWADRSGFGDCNRTW